MRPTPEEDITFIKDRLLPEMVSAGCFDESSRAVNFNRKKPSIKAIVRPYPFQLRDYHLDFTLYRAQIDIVYSNASSTFKLMVKLLPKDCTYSTLTQALIGFQNEEYFWKKVSPHVGRHLLPKFYAAEMQKYGRPVVVVDDLEMNGFQRPIDPRQLSTEETMIVLKHIGRLHGKGMALKKARPQLYMEIRDGFKEITFFASDEARIRRELSRMSKQLGKLTINGALVSKLLQSYPYQTYREAFELEPVTICNGFTYRGNMWFKYDAEGNVKEVKLLDWQRACSGSNCFDFVLINEEGDHRSYWKDFRNAYYEAVKKEYPEATEKSLFENYSKAGLCYKLILSMLCSRCVSPPDGEMPHVPESSCALM